MKRLLFFLCLFLIPIGVGATSLTLSLDCPNHGAANSNVTCNLTANPSNGSINGINAKFEFSSGVTFQSIVGANNWSLFSGTSNGFNIGNTSGSSSSLVVARLTIKLPNANANTTHTVTIKNVDASDTEFNSLTSNSPTATIRITSNINTLSSLAINNSSINFNSSTNTYNVTVDASTTIISATKTDNNSSISGDIGSKNLSYGLNTFKIVVTSENNIKNTYILNITRPDNRNTDTSLSSLTVSNTNLSYNGSDTYNATVANDITKVNINAITTSASATLTGLGSKNLIVGNNTFKVVVTAEKGNTKTYTINITRNALVNTPVTTPSTTPVTEQETPASTTKPVTEQTPAAKPLSNNNYLKSLSIKDQIIAFNKDVVTYDLTVAYNIESLEIIYEVEDPKATTSIDGPNKLKIGLNTYLINVTSENNEIKTYTINVTRKDERVIVDNNNQNIIEALTNNNLVYVNVAKSNNINVSKEALALIKDNKSLIYEVKEKDKVLYSVTLNNGVYINQNKDLDIGLLINKENNNIVLNTNDSNITYKINVGDYYQDKELLYLYHYAKENPRLLQGSIEVNDGYITINDLDSDKYILSNELLNKENRNVVLICIITAETILLIAAIGYIYIFKFKKSKNNLL